MRNYKEIERWRDVSDEQWNDWKWQLKNRITSVEALAEIIDISDKEKKEIHTCLEKFKMGVTPYYASLMEPSNPDCPVRKQAVPNLSELYTDGSELLDPLAEEHFSPVPNIVHRYPDRVLFLVTRKCAMYCRHCTRRRVVGEEDFSIGGKDLERALDYIRANPVIRDVLISGGDPLVMSDSFLERILSGLRNIPHVEIIRIGTRTPVVLPMRMTDELLGMLKKYHPVWINTHFNHPKEVTEAAQNACLRIVDAGIPLGNQSVLLRGINDRTEVLKELFLKLVKIRVRPYYLYQCDVAQGIGHFRTAVQTGVDIIKGLRGYISGFAVPTFVIDAPGGGGKIPVGPDYVESLGEDKVVLHNYKDEIYEYPNPR